MAVKKKSEKRIKKEAYYKRLQETALKYKNALFVDADNVSSLQICNIRKELRKIDAVMIMGKNTLMKAAISAANTKPEEGDSDYEERKDSYVYRKDFDLILNQLRGNTGIIFSNGDLGEVKKVIDSERRSAPAKTGLLAPEDVWIKAGPTGLDPKQTSFFQQLQITTKIQKGQIEITADKQVVFQDTRVTATQSALLDKLNIRPFSYKMFTKKVLQEGSLFDSKVLDLSTEDILNKFRGAVGNLTSLSLGAEYPTALSAPHSILNAFKNLAAVSFASDYNFKEAEALKEAAANAPAASAAAVVDDAPKEEEPKEVEEEEQVDMGGLFGGDDDEY